MSDNWIDAAQRLVDLLQKENEALKRLDFPAAVALVAAKEAALADLTKPPATPMAPAPLAPAPLAPAPLAPAPLARRLVALAAENRSLLERAIAVQTRIVQIIARAAVPPPATMRYNGYGGRTARPRSAALAVSTRA